MATNTNAVKRFASGPLHGTSLALYFALLPYVVLSKWRLAAHQSNGVLIRALLVGLAVFWLLFLLQLVRNIIQLRRGLLIGGGGSAWLASLLVASLPFLISAAAVTSLEHSRTAAAAPSALRSSEVTADRSRIAPHRRSARSPDISVMSAVPLALMAKRRRDALRQQQFELDDQQIDDTIELLRASSPSLIAQLRHLIGERRDGVIEFSGDLRYAALASGDEPVVVCVLSDDSNGVLLSFAREGGALRVPAHWSEEDIAESAVALLDGGVLKFAHLEHELLRALATRSFRHSMVLFTGAARDLDDELRACSVMIQPVILEEELRELAHQGEFASSARPRSRVAIADPNGPEPGEIRVEMLWADPRIVGLGEPFTPTLRRRCVEMVAYLALHRHEPVTGDRLRTRVLARADVDASTRTLANTASAVRRSLGTDARGPLLHPVTSSGLYVTHGVTSDIEIFHALIARARQLPLDQAAPFVQRALSLVHGEPLASALRGFEWFLVEGFSARLQRDGEWASLALHEHALDTDDVELAFWSLSQGRRIDPHSDALVDALARVPRLRQFGRDGTGRAQDQTVGSGRTVAMGGPLHRLGD